MLQLVKPLQICVHYSCTELVLKLMRVQSSERFQKSTLILVLGKQNTFLSNLSSTSIAILLISLYNNNV